MRAYIALLCKCLFATRPFTAVRLLAGVSPFMSPEIASLGKRQAAAWYLTCVRLSTGMGAVVYFKMSLLSEPFVAVGPFANENLLLLWLPGRVEGVLLLLAVRNKLGNGCFALGCWCWSYLLADGVCARLLDRSHKSINLSVKLCQQGRIIGLVEHDRFGTGRVTCGSRSDSRGDGATSP